MNILLTNDDGIYAEGLWAIYRQFSDRHSVTVIAPDREQSAVSHGITIYEPLRAKRIEYNGFSGYAINGKPADCVKLGILELLEQKPDIVISGINLGANVGINVNYSGTVAGAKEGALHGIPGIAVSVQGFDVRDFSAAAAFTQKIAHLMFDKGLPYGTFLNVNVPNGALKDMAGVKISRQGLRPASEYYEKRVDPRNHTYHWLCGDFLHSYGDDPEVDGNALPRNYITITPIRCDMTDYNMMEDLKSWDIRV
jgi:5'-nucleotidase